MRRIHKLDIAAAAAIAIACFSCQHDGHEHHHDHGEVPDEYASLRNPLATDPGAAGRGQAHYRRYCTDCHGDQARGNGPLADRYTPRPTDLVEVAGRDDVTDGYLFWRISDGGDDAGTAMPAWRDRLSVDQTWELISFLYDRAMSAQ